MLYYFTVHAMHRKHIQPSPDAYGFTHAALATALDTDVPGMTTVQWRSLALSGDIST